MSGYLAALHRLGKPHDACHGVTVSCGMSNAVHACGCVLGGAQGTDGVPIDGILFWAALVSRTRFARTLVPSASTSSCACMMGRSLRTLVGAALRWPPFFCAGSDGAGISDAVLLCCTEEIGALGNEHRKP